MSEVRGDICFRFLDLGGFARFALPIDFAGPLTGSGNELRSFWLAEVIVSDSKVQWVFFAWYGAPNMALRFSGNYHRLSHALLGRAWVWLIICHPMHECSSFSQGMPRAIL